MRKNSFDYEEYRTFLELEVKTFILGGQKFYMLKDTGEYTSDKSIFAQKALERFADTINFFLEDNSDEANNV